MLRHQQPHRRSIAAVTLLAAVLLAAPATSLAGDDHVQAKLLADTRAIQAGQTFTLGVKLNMEKGWHVYWRNPGDAGLATDVTFSLPEGFHAGPLLWPEPMTFQQPGKIDGYGYKDEVLLTAEIHAPDKLPADDKLKFSADVSWLACKEKCIPGKAQLGLELPQGKAAPANKKLFAAWEKRTPPAAPNFVLKDHRGREVNLHDLAGKVVVLEWINWDCPFVVRHMKAGTMRKLASEYAAHDVVWLGINSTKYQNADINAQHVEKYELPYLVLDDHPGKIGRLYQAKTTPHMYVIDQAGQIVYAGAIDNDPRGKKPDGKVVNYVEQALSQAAANKPVTQEDTKPYGCSVKYAN
jgi:DsbC/DsbD-like thiol-disulfide interchange protein